MILSLRNISLLIICFACCGCLFSKNPARKIDYYTLEYPSPKLDQRPKLPLVIRVERFTTAPFYNSDKIVFRAKKFTRNTYTYHKWRAYPGDMVSYFIARDLRNSSNYQAVFAVNGNIPPSYTIEGTVDEFFEQDESEAWEAVLKVGIAVLKQNEPDISKRIVFQKNYQSTHTCKQKNPTSLAESMSEALADISKQIQVDLYNHLKSNR